MERARQLVGEMLIYCFVLVLLTGGFLAFHYTPSGELVPYDGGYEPLHGTMMTRAYDSLLTLSFDVPRGLLMRQLHAQFSTLLVLGTVVWALLGRFRYVFALLGLGLSLFGTLTGQGSADEFPAAVPIPLWYGLHLLAALAMAAALVISSRREAARDPRTPAFTALSLGLALLLIFWPF
jgi:hypothetical protein